MKRHHTKRRQKDRPRDYYRNYERRRKNGGKLFKARFKFILKRIRKFLKAYPEHRQMLCVLVTWILIKKYSCSLRGMVEECEARPGLCRKLDMDHVPSKSWLHKWMKRIPLDLLDSLLLLTAGSGSRRTLSVDSTQYTFNRYVEVEDARRGKYYKKSTIKQHALITEDLRIVAVIVTDGNAGDSPALARLCARAPRGSGYMLGDSAYCSRENCRLAAGLDREPCFRPKKGFVPHGMDEWGRMLAWCRDRPGTFYRTYGRRNTIESCFSAVKNRFNFRIRSVTLEMQQRKIAVMSICRNLFG